jgi:site-specific DNA-cytosine methylase
MQRLKDSSMSRQGLPDYLITMRKPGVNAELAALGNAVVPQVAEAIGRAILRIAK